MRRKDRTDVEVGISTSFEYLRKLRSRLNKLGAQIGLAQSYANMGTEYRCSSQEIVGGNSAPTQA
jgi:hypothetical protein